MNKFDKQHQLNVRKYQRRIDAIYKKTAEEAARRAASLPVPDDYIFTFDDFPAVKKQIDALMATMAADVEMTVTDGVRAEWDLANAKNDALVDSVFGDMAALAKYHRTHEDALAAFLERKQNGLGLSDRVWRYTSQFKDEIEMGLDLGIREGQSAATIARSIQQYLKYPDMLFRRVKDEHGVFQLSQRAAAFHPGQGVYRSSYKNALRLAATETNIAYRSADHERIQDLDFIVGIEIHLSNNHTVLNHKKERMPLFDICDELQGKYPKEFKFTGWHPNCRCIQTNILKTKAELEADDERLKRGEQPSDSSTSENAVTEMPDGFKQWMDDNAERLESAKSTPYFIRDNFKDGDPSQGLRWINDVVQPTEKMVEHYETIGDVEKKLNEVGTDWIAGTENGKFNFNHIPESKLPAAGETDGNGNIFITGKKQIVSAFEKIARGLIDEITVNEQRDLQVLWHEITHCRNKYFGNVGGELSAKISPFMEGANEWVSRKTFGDFMSRIGAKKIPHPEMLLNDPLNGLYNTYAVGIDKVIDTIGLDKDKVFSSMKKHLFNEEYKTIKKGILQSFEDGGLTTINGRKLTNKEKDMFLDMVWMGGRMSAKEIETRFGIKILR